MNDEDVILYANGRGESNTFCSRNYAHFPSNAFASIVNLYNVHLEAVPNLKGKPDVAIEDQKKIHHDISSQVDQINNQLTEISKLHYSYLKGAEEELDIENKKLEVIKSLGGTKDTFAMEGWIPKSKMDSIKTSFQKYSEGTTRFMNWKLKKTLLRFWIIQKD